MTNPRNTEATTKATNPNTATPKPGWQISEDTCPKCNILTDQLFVEGDEGHMEIQAERCTTCGWVINFDDL